MTTTQTNATVGPIGRLGRWTATHFGAVVAAWVVVAVGLGVFAPRAEKALSGAGWEATDSESVQARQLIKKDFNGLGSYGLVVVVDSPGKTVSAPAFRRALRGVEVTLKRDPAVTADVTAPAGVAISPDSPTGLLHAGRAARA